MVTHPGFGITTQEIDQHQEEIQVNYFQSILKFEQKKIVHEFKRVFVCTWLLLQFCQIDFSFIKEKNSS